MYLIVYSVGMSTEQLKQAEVRAERWRIAYEVLEEQYLDFADRSANVIETLQMTVSDLLRERNDRIDEKFDGKTNPQPTEE